MNHRELSQIYLSQKHAPLQRSAIKLLTSQLQQKDVLLVLGTSFGNGLPITVAEIFDIASLR